MTVAAGVDTDTLCGFLDGKILLIVNLRPKLGGDKQSQKEK